MTPNLPKFSDDKAYWLTGRMLNKFMRELRRMAPVAGEGLGEDCGPNGTIIYALEEEKKGTPSNYGTSWDDGGTGLTGRIGPLMDVVFDPGGGGELEPAVSLYFTNGRLTGVTGG